MGAALLMSNSYAQHISSTYLYCEDATNSKNQPDPKWETARWDNPKIMADPPATSVTTELPIIWSHNNWVAIAGFQSKTKWGGWTLWTSSKKNWDAYNTYTPEQAKDACDALVKICTDRFGPDYRYIGAGAGGTVWGRSSSVSLTIAKGYYSPGGEFYTCPSAQKGISQNKVNEQGNEYQVTCLDPLKSATFTHGATKYWVNTTDPKYPEKYSFTPRGSQPTIQELDKYVGEKFCR